MDPLAKYPVLRSTFSPFRRSQQKSLGAVVGALLEVACANSIAMASRIAQCFGVQLPSALNRVYRLLHNPRIDDALLSLQILRLFAGAQRRLLIAIDWTEWHSDLRMLLASVVTGRRAVPAYAAAFGKQDMPRSQNSRENALLALLALHLRQLGQAAVLLCDRGFRRVSWVQQLQQRGLSFVVRLMDDVSVHHGGRVRRLKDFRLRRGQVRDLGVVPLRRDGRVCARVVGVWAPRSAEPWWLVTDLDDSVADIAALYDRRMTIEEQIRDSKGCRFGLKLEWTQFRNPAHLGRLMCLVGVALAIWTAAGAAAVERSPTLQLRSKSKGARLSLPKIGAYWLDRVRTGALLGVLWVRSYLPPPTLREFTWIQSAPALPEAA